MSRAQFTVAISTDEEAAASKRMVIYAFSAQINQFTSFFLEEMSDNPSPLYFLYDCEGTGESIYKDHIVEIAASLQPLPSNLHVKTKLPTTFQSLVNTSKKLHI